jgi:hypothetical protein
MYSHFPTSRFEWEADDLLRWVNVDEASVQVLSEKVVRDLLIINDMPSLLEALTSGKVMHLEEETSLSEAVSKHATSEDVSLILGALARGNMTSWFAQWLLSETVRSKAMAKDVPLILDALASGNTTPEQAQWRLSGAVNSKATAGDVPRILDVLISGKVTSKIAQMYLADAVECLIDPASPEHQSAFSDALPALREIPAISWYVAKIEEIMQSTTAVPSTQFKSGPHQPAAGITNGTSNPQRRQITNDSHR